MLIPVFTLLPLLITYLVDIRPIIYIDFEKDNPIWTNHGAEFVMETKPVNGVCKEILKMLMLKLSKAESINKKSWTYDISKHISDLIKYHRHRSMIPVISSLSSTLLIQMNPTIEDQVTWYRSRKILQRKAPLSTLRSKPSDVKSGVSKREVPID